VEALPSGGGTAGEGSWLGFSVSGWVSLRIGLVSLRIEVVSPPCAHPAPSARPPAETYPHLPPANVPQASASARKMTPRAPGTAARPLHSGWGAPRRLEPKVSRPGRQLVH